MAFGHERATVGGRPPLRGGLFRALECPYGVLNYNFTLSKVVLAVDLLLEAV